MIKSWKLIWKFLTKQSQVPFSLWSVFLIISHNLHQQLSWSCKCSNFHFSLSTLRIYCPRRLKSWSSKQELTKFSRKFVYFELKQLVFVMLLMFGLTCILHVGLNKSSDCGRPTCCLLSEASAEVNVSQPLSALLACVVLAALSECDLLHKQVTLLSNGLLCHSCTPPPRSLTAFTHSRFLPDDYSDEWVRRSAVRPPAALHKQHTIKKESDFLIGGTERVMEESQLRKHQNKKCSERKRLEVIMTHNALQWIPCGPHLILSLVDKEAEIILSLFPLIFRIICTDFSSSLSLSLQAILHCNVFPPFCKHSRSQRVSNF